MVAVLSARNVQARAVPPITQHHHFRELETIYRQHQLNTPDSANRIDFSCSLKDEEYEIS